MESVRLMLLNPAWRWEEMCGKDGFHPWNPQTRDLGFCFQRLFLIIPALFMLAIISAYYAGNQMHWVVRGKLQMFAINFRCVVVLCLAVIPLVQGYLLLIRKNTVVVPIDYFTLGTEFITWSIHLAFTQSMRKRLGLSPRGPVLILVAWSMTAVLSIVSLRSMFLQGRPYWEELLVVLLQICYLISLIPGKGVTSLTSPGMIGSEYAQIGEQQPLLYHFIEDDDVLGTALADVPFLSKLLFYWVNPLFLRGSNNKLKDPDDLFDLPHRLSCSNLSIKIEKALIGNVDRYQRNEIIEPNASLTSSYQGNYNTNSYGSLGESSIRSSIPSVQVISPKQKYNVSLLRALHSCFGVEFYAIGLLRLLSDISGFAGPLLLNKLVLYVEDKNIDANQGYIFIFGLLLASLIGAFSEAHFNMYMAIVTLKLRAAIISTVFHKTLSVSSTNLNKNFNYGEVTNFISTDTDRIINACPSFHAVWSIPLQIVITLYLLYRQVGLSFLSGVVFTIILIPINKYVANKIGVLSTKLMKHKDDRVSLMTEIVKGIRTIKLHAWEGFFVNKIKDHRQMEIKYLKGRKYLDAVCVFLWATTPILITSVTLVTYVLSGNELEAATVFTTIALLNMLIAPLNAFPWVLNGVTEAWVSLKRIQKFLDLQDFNSDYYMPMNRGSDIILSMSNATFSWIKTITDKSKHSKPSHKVKSRKGKISKNGQSKNNLQKQENSVDENSASEASGPFQIRNLSLCIKQGNFIGIIGKVGSGKSSLLSAILGEMVKIDGEIAFSEVGIGIGYVSQKPWLQRGTIRDNILFGKPYEESKYRAVVAACGLSEDLALLGSGACVGEGGSTLSGGQAARVALARACYQDKHVYLLDDILSSVDVNVGSHIYNNCLMGFLRNKTRILVTHSLKYVVQADHVIVMEDGMIVRQGTPHEVISDIDDYIATSDEEMTGNEIKSPLSPTMTSLELKDDQSTDSLMEEEVSAQGNLDFGILVMYWKSIGHGLAIAILLSLTMMQTSRNLTDLWLSYWVSPSNVTANLTIFMEDFQMPTTLTPETVTKTIGDDTSNGIIKNIINNTENWLHNALYPSHTDNIYTKTFSNSSDNGHIMYYLSVYMGLAATNAFFTLIRSFLFAYGGIQAAIKLHKSLLKTVIKAKMKFFDLTPVGRLMNRFSSDTYTVDDSLPFIMNILLAQTFGILGSLIVTAYGLPWICLVIVPLIPIYHWLQHRYRLTSRELKRLSSVTLSPIYSHFNDTLDGAVIIKAHARVNRWERMGEHLVERCQRAIFCSSAATQWLGIRLRLMGTAVLTGTAVVAVIQRNLDYVDPGLVGLVITYSLSITSLLGGVINAFTETEREMIAVERVGEYIREVESEEEKSGVLTSPYGWPNMGIICFNNVVMKYRPHLAPTLKGISFETFPGEKVGVVGRTGAGKSSLFAAIFRLCELSSGNIVIDTVDVSQLALITLRSHLAIIPQEPFIFNGTIRENLDPLNEYHNNELWKAVEKCGANVIIQNRGGLESSASDLSRGHMQLLCLARAILKNAKILCIDEATANVDQETDRLIQQAIRFCFRKSTVITIAHRISTVMSSDRVLVMNDGHIVEFNTPDNLMSDPNSYFYQLISQEKVD